jgi:CheY-specific phosphatase CheX
VQPDRPPEVVEAFTAATVTAFQELTATEVVAAEPGALAADVFAVIALRRPTAGRLVLAFPEAVLAALAGRYLPAGAALGPELLEDTAGEFANVIAGQAKTMLKGTPYHFTLSPPQVSRTPPPGAEGTAPLILTFAADVGAFLLQVELPACPGEC